MYKYSFVKSLFKHYKKTLKPSCLKKQDVKAAVKEEIRKLSFLKKISPAGTKELKKYLRNTGVIYADQINRAFEDKSPLIKWNHLNRIDYRKRRKILISIGESVRNFLADKLARERIENGKKD